MSIKEEYDRLKLGVISLKSKKDHAVENLKSNKLSLQQVEEDLLKYSQQRATLLGSIDVMKQLIDILSREQIDQLKELISYGLSTIFVDRNYSIDIVISESKNVKQANFVLVETLADGSVIRSDFKDSIGGGVLSVVGLIIQVYYILYYNLYPILFMDEALSQISTMYLPSVIEFIDQLAQKKHFKFVLITHDERLIEYGTKVYSVKSGEVSLVRG